MKGERVDSVVCVACFRPWRGQISGMALAGISNLSLVHVWDIAAYLPRSCSHSTVPKEILNRQPVLILFSWRVVLIKWDGCPCSPERCSGPALPGRCRATLRKAIAPCPDLHPAFNVNGWFTLQLKGCFFSRERRTCLAPPAQDLL